MRTFGANRVLLLCVATTLTTTALHAAPAWEEQANRRIEQIRMGTLRVQVIDTDGRPVPGATVSVKQTRHAFRFGTAVALHRLTEPGADNEQYRDTLKRCFNMAEPENELKWGPWEGEFDPQRFGARFKPEDFSREKTIAGLRWLKANGFYVRGHNLVWPSYRRSPQFLSRYTAEDHAGLASIIRNHILEEATAIRPYIDECDVVNEPADHVDLLKLLGPIVMAEWFKAAREVLPTTPLYLNEADLIAGQNSLEKSRAITEENLKTLIANDAPIDGVGLQAHVRWDRRLSMPEVLAYLDHIRDLGLSIAITELDVRGCTEAELGEHTRDLLTACFSHPAVKNIHVWGFWEGDIQRPPYAPFRKDWTPRPNGEAYVDLVLKKWWTDLSGSSDKDGVFGARAFFGEHEVTAQRAGKQVRKSVRLSEGTETKSVVLVL